MLLLNPELVTFGAAPWPDVTAVIIDRRATRRAIDFSDSGPHPVFADAPEQQILITITRRLVRDELDAPLPGQRAGLVLLTTPGGARADAHQRRITIDAVVLDIKTDLAAPGAKEPTRTITLIPLSEDGAADPVAIDET